MPEVDGLFTTVEEYGNMTIEQLQVPYRCLFAHFLLSYDIIPLFLSIKSPNALANAFFFHSILRLAK
jgi:hypothetical protein